jgi:hypothetical protein
MVNWSVARVFRDVRGEVAIGPVLAVVDAVLVEGRSRVGAAEDVGVARGCALGCLIDSFPTSAPAG